MRPARELPWQSQPPMSGSPEVQALKRKLRAQLTGGTFETLSEALLDIVSRLFTVLTVGQISCGFWGAVAIVYVLCAFGTLALAAVSSSFTDATGLRITLFHVWASFVAVCQLVSARYYARQLREVLAVHVVNRMVRPADLKGLSRWLEGTFNIRRQFNVCIFIAVIVGIGSIFAAHISGRSDLLSAGTVVLYVFGWFLGATGWYFLIPGATVSRRLSHYEYDIYPLDPACSLLIESISQMMQSCLFVGVTIATVFTSGVVLLGPNNRHLQIIFVVVGAWAPLITILVLNQYALARIIERAKRRALEPIQVSTMELQSKINTLPAPDLDRLNKLLDLHARILTAKRTAIDWKGSIASFNTLLLPAITLVIGLYHPHLGATPAAKEKHETNAVPQLESPQPPDSDSPDPD